MSYDPENDDPADKHGGRYAGRDPNNAAIFEVEGCWISGDEWLEQLKVKEINERLRDQRGC